MKKTLFAALFLVMAAGQAQAAWTDDFLKEYDEFGIDTAVENALENKITPSDILKFILSQNDAFKTKITMKALYCAAVDHDVMQQVAAQLGISDEELGVAHEESIQECGSTLALSDRDRLEVPDTDGGNGQPNNNNNSNNSGGGNSGGNSGGGNSGGNSGGGNSGGNSGGGNSGGNSGGGNNPQPPASPSSPAQLN
jgi:hypothetical protein